MAPNAQASTGPSEPRKWLTPHFKQQERAECRGELCFSCRAGQFVIRTEGEHASNHVTFLASTGRKLSTDSMAQTKPLCTPLPVTNSSSIPSGLFFFNVGNSIKVNIPWGHPLANQIASNLRQTSYHLCSCLFFPNSCKHNHKWHRHL